MRLRKEGFKAAHPNDGWVDRENNIITLCYPQFNDGVGVGDKMMLGRADDKPEKLRPVLLVEKLQSTPFFDNRFVFEDIVKSKVDGQMLKFLNCRLGIVHKAIKALLILLGFWAGIRLVVGICYKWNTTTMLFHIVVLFGCMNLGGV